MAITRAPRYLLNYTYLLQYFLPLNTSELESLEERVNSKQLNHNLNERSLASAQNQIIELERRIQTNEHERMNRLAQLHPDTFRAVHWIRANKDKFKNPDGVFEPLLFQLDVQDIQAPKTLCTLKFTQSYLISFLSLSLLSGPPSGTTLPLTNCNLPLFAQKHSLLWASQRTGDFGVV